MAFRGLDGVTVRCGRCYERPRLVLAGLVVGRDGPTWDGPTFGVRVAGGVQCRRCKRTFADAAITGAVESAQKAGRRGAIVLGD